jgi:sugar lactone lactonase YvrE
MKKLLFCPGLLLALIAIPNLFGAQIITNLAGTAPAGFAGDSGPATAAKLDYAMSITADNTGNIYFCDYGNNRVREINVSGVITTIAGTGTSGYSGDGGLAINATLNGPMGIAVDPNGANVYIADNINNRVRKVTMASGIITTYAGTGVLGGAGDGGPADSAQIRTPEGLAIDAGGDLYIVDNYSQIRKVNGSAHVISTVAGGGVNPPIDGSIATSVYLYLEYIAVDTNGNLFLSSPGYHLVRKIEHGTGILSTIAGTGIGGFSGDGGAGSSAEVYYPYGLATDLAGNVYIADESNNRVRKVDASSGIISTYAGNGVYTDAGDGGAALSAAISHPYSIAIDHSGNMIVSDSSFSIRKITTITGIQELNTSVAPRLFPVPCSGAFTLETFGAGYTAITIYDLSGRALVSEPLNPASSGERHPFVIDAEEGLYLVQLKKMDKEVYLKLMIRN